MSGMVEVLAAHQVRRGDFINWCTCGNADYEDRTNTLAAHADHVAAMLSAAGYGPVAEAKAADVAAEPEKHHRVGPGACVCGFSAYKVAYYVWDYGDELQRHLRSRARAAAVRGEG